MQQLYKENTHSAVRPRATERSHSRTKALLILSAITVFFTASCGRHEVYIANNSPIHWTNMYFEDKGTSSIPLTLSDVPSTSKTGWHSIESGTYWLKAYGTLMTVTNTDAGSNEYRLITNFQVRAIRCDNVHFPSGELRTRRWKFEIKPLTVWGAHDQWRLTEE